MTTEIWLTNHPETKITLENGAEMSRDQRYDFAREYINEVDPRQARNLFILTRLVGTVKDNPTCTTFRTGLRVLFRDEYRPKDSNLVPLRLKDGETAISFMLPSDNTPIPFLTIRRLYR